jgi:hypothetical protein
MHTPNAHAQSAHPAILSPSLPPSLPLSYTPCALCLQIVTLLDDILVPRAARTGLVGVHRALVNVDGLHQAASEFLSLRRRLFERYAVRIASDKSGRAGESVASGVPLHVFLAMSELVDPTLRRARVKAAFLHSIPLGAVGGSSPPPPSPRSAPSLPGVPPMQQSQQSQQAAPEAARVLDEKTFWEAMVRLALLHWDSDSGAYRGGEEPVGGELPFPLADISLAQLGRLRSALEAMERAVDTQAEQTLIASAAAKEMQACARAWSALKKTEAVATEIGTPLKHFKLRSKARKQGKKQRASKKAGGGKEGPVDA